VPFGRRSETGFVIRVHDQEPTGFAIKDISSLIDDEPVFDDRLVALAKKISEDYICATGEALSIALPAATSSGIRKKEQVVRNNFNADDIVLSDEQDIVSEAIWKDRDSSKVHLLYGVTGSGKTEVYIKLVSRVIAEGRSAIILVPEISLSAQLFERFESYFADQLVLFHSTLTPNQRLLSWKRFYSGEARVAVGTRSAVFMQCPDLGLIVIDEEHDGSYKEHSTPRYNARRVAMLRTRDENALLLLGSATPSMESLYAAHQGAITLHRLNRRYGGSELPKIEVVSIEGAFEDDLISVPLKIATKHAVDNGRQAIFLLNRRGFSPIMMCRTCKKKIECPDCSISLNYHRDGSLICHYCGYTRNQPESCPSCGADQLVKIGSGTQRIEELIEKTFYGKNIFRLDQDSARKKNSSSDLMEKMRDGTIDILVGTQMVAKGFDFKNVDIVGVVMADIGMNLPDFRASERIFSLLIQVAGRCGRGEHPGRVIIQTLNPDHDLLGMIVRHDYDAFYQSELAMRKLLLYPPFARIARLLLRGRDEEKVRQAAAEVASIVNKYVTGKNATLLGPSPAPMEKIGGNFRHHLIIKSRDGDLLRKIARSAYQAYGKSEPYLEIDIDPFDMM
jgi:primosomal protein N' (replication factor Y)